MQINGKLQIVRYLRGIGIAAFFALGGVAMVVLSIFGYFNPEDPATRNNFFILTGVGVVLFIGSVIAIVLQVKNIKKQKPLTEEEVKANEAKFSANAPYIENVKDTKLFFHFGGKLNQSFFADNIEGKTLYECKLVKFNPFGANTFEFTDVENKYTKVVKVGKTVTTSSDGGLPIIGDVMTSRFKIDGVMCWDYLRERGYKVDHYILEGGKIMSYKVEKLGKAVAYIHLANIKDPWNENSKNIFFMGRGVYRLEIIDAKLEDIVMAAFIISNSEIVE